jgi:hypothetical protein
MRYLVVVLVLLMCTGCGTILKKRMFSVEINTTPSDAMVKISDMVENDPTPTSVTIERGQSYLVEITKPGFEQKWIVLQKRKHRSIIVADICTLGVGILVDWYTGKWYGVTPSRIDVFLDPISHNDSGRDINLQLTESSIYTPDKSVNLKLYMIDDASSDLATLIQSVTR